jgi:hypothetical protein
MSDGGKGSKPRPYSVTQDEYDTRWDLIFGKDKSKDDNTDFEVNDPDPDKRNWYYDDHGIKRKK